MLGFCIVKPSFSFTDVKTITIPAICSVNNSGLLWTINTVLVRKERFYTSSALKNNLKVNTRVEFVHTRANCWDCNGFYIGKTKRRLHDRKTEHFKALAKSDNTSAIADHVKTTGHNIKWDQFDILAKGKTDYHCKIKETLYIQELEPAFNVNVGSEKLMLY